MVALGALGKPSLDTNCDFSSRWWAKRRERPNLARLPPHPRLFVIGEDRGLRFDWLADEGRLKFPLFLDRQLKRAVNLF
eukprot:COSAG02_NODE_32936_length_508_cov_0.801956_1_plen_78_part_01